MDDLFALADSFGPAKIVHIHQPGSGLKAVVAIDNVAAGPAIGGVRMAPDVSTVEAVRLARAMTLKNAMAGLAHGGGKSVIFGDPQMPHAEKERVVRAFAQAIRDLREYIPGPDMGTDETCMAWVSDEIGRSVGLPRELGGIPLDEIGATGWGLFHAIQVAYERMGRSLAGARVVVQGYGAVGRHAMRFLAQEGAVLVGACDSHGAVHDSHGLDPARLNALKRAGRQVTDYPGAQRLERDAVIDLECDIWIPAARPDVLDEHNVGRLRTALVAEGANIPCTPGAERLLHERGVLVLPDFVANAGGVICAAVEYHGGTEGGAFETIRERIRGNIACVLEQSAQQGVPPRQAAVELAHQRVERAMSFARFGGAAAGNGQGAPGQPHQEAPCTASAFTAGEARA
ncbi:MAG TPA: Glu/Leu/Phe/Val dehydrogenase [bacterium]|nr:Glu/Leu/Phe/Val dehydrogenase [bacterium]